MTHPEVETLVESVLIKAEVLKKEHEYKVYGRTTQKILKDCNKLLQAAIKIEEADYIKGYNN